MFTMRHFVEQGTGMGQLDWPEKYILNETQLRQMSLYTLPMILQDYFDHADISRPVFAQMIGYNVDYLRQILYNTKRIRLPGLRFYKLCYQAMKSTGHDHDATKIRMYWSYEWQTFREPIEKERNLRRRKQYEVNFAEKYKHLDGIERQRQRREKLVEDLQAQKLEQDRKKSEELDRQFTALGIKPKWSQ